MPMTKHLAAVVHSVLYMVSGLFFLAVRAIEFLAHKESVFQISKCVESRTWKWLMMIGNSASKQATQNCLMMRC